MNRSLAKFVFLTAESIRGEPISKILRELEKSQWYSAAKIRELQWYKLKKLLDHAYATVPFYRDLFKRNAIRPEDIKNPEDFGRVPLLTKETFRQNMKTMLSVNHLKRMSKAKTSGSTGISLDFYKDRVASGYHRAAIFRGHRWYGLDIGALEARLWAVPVERFQRIFTSATDYLMNRFRPQSINLNEKVLLDFYRKMRRRKPDYLKGYPSLIYEFALFLQENRLNGSKFNLRMIECTSETLLDFYRQVIQDVFDCRVVSQYGSAETGIISFECPDGGHHLMADCIYEEYMDLGNDAFGNQIKEIVITDLHNYSLPIIRYQLGDKVTPEHTLCSCGRGLPLIKSVDGRYVDYVVGSNGNRFHDSLFDYLMRTVSQKISGIRQFKVYQISKDHLKIQLVSDHHSDRITKYVSEKTKAYLGADMRIDFEFVEKIPRDKSGKLRIFVSELHQNEV